jgi:hypothetical protein
MLAGGPMGALYGMGRGMGDIEENRLATEKYNRELALKTWGHSLEERKLGAEEQRWQVLNQQAEENMKNLELQRQQLRLNLTEAERSTEAREKYRQSLPEEKRLEFDTLGPEKFYERVMEDQAIRGAAPMLKRFGIDENLARYLGPRGTGGLLGTILESRQRGGEKADKAFHFDPSSGYSFVFDRRTGTVTKEKQTEPKAPVDERIRVRNQMLTEWGKTNPLDSRLPDAMDRFEEWASSPEGLLQERYLLREIPAEEYRGWRESISRQNKEDEGRAMEWMKQEYMKAGRGQTPQGFQAYVRSEEGKENLNEYRRALQKRERDRAQQRQQQPTAPQAQPQPRTQPAGKQGEKKRRSLDEIAKDAFGAPLGG